MGRSKRIIPKEMPGKLKLIREQLDLTLEQMSNQLEIKLQELDYAGITLYSGNIHEYEKGTREPMLPVLIAYARLGKITLDELVEDNPRNNLKDM